MDETNSYWYQRYIAMKNINGRLEDQIKVLTEQSDYWFNLFTESDELLTRANEEVDDLEYQLVKDYLKYDNAENTILYKAMQDNATEAAALAYPVLEEDWIN